MFTAADCYKLVFVESSIIWSFGVTRAFNCQFIAGWLNYNRVRFYHIFTYLHLQWTLWYQSAIKLSIFIQLRSNVVSVMINISDGIYFVHFFNGKPRFRYEDVSAHKTIELFRVLGDRKMLKPCCSHSSVG